MSSYRVHITSAVWNEKAKYAGEQWLHALQHGPFYVDAVTRGEAEKFVRDNKDNYVAANRMILKVKAAKIETDVMLREIGAKGLFDDD